MAMILEVVNIHGGLLRGGGFGFVRGFGESAYFFVVFIVPHVLLLGDGGHDGTHFVV